MLDLQVVQLLGDHPQEARELAEHDHAVPLADHLGEVVEEPLELRAGHGGVLVVDDLRRQREHPQQRERREDGEPVAVHVPEQAQHLAALALEHAVVELAVGRLELHLEDLLLLGRQVLRHELLGAAQHERAHAAAQGRHPLGVLPGLDGGHVGLAEPAVAREQARHDDAQQRPQVAEGVLHRRAGDGQPEGGAQVAGHRVHLRGAVLQELCLVEDHPAPVESAVLAGVDPQERVAGDHHVRPRHLVRHGGAALAGGGVQDAHVEVRGELLGLGRPHGHHGARRDHEERRPLGPGLARVGEEREGLDGLAQAHVVGQDPAEVLLPQEREPAQALLLVGAQVGLQAGGARGLGEALDGGQTPDGGGPLRVLVHLVRELLEVLPEADLVP